MKLLIIHQYFAGPSESGGTRHFELSRHLVRAGHDVSIVASDTSYITGRRVVDRPRLMTRQTLDGIRVLRAYTYPSLHRSFVWRAVSLISFMATSLWAGLRAGKVDLVMSTSPPLFQPVAAWLVARIRRRPFLLEIRDLWPEFAIDIGVLKNPLLIKLSRWLERFLYARADHILVNSPAYRDYLLARGISEAKVSLIANGVDPDMFQPEAQGESIRERYHLQSQFVVTYAGALGLANDIETILRSAQRLRNQRHIQFLLVGDGKERTNLERLAAAAGLTNVTFAGSRPKTEMADVLAASDVCVATLRDIPMFRTTYPNKVFDYMAAGRPIVLGIDGVIRTVVEAAGAGVFVPPGDDVALAEAVRHLASDPAAAKQMGHSGRAYVSEHFNRHAQAADFERLIHRIAGG